MVKDNRSFVVMRIPRVGFLVFFTVCLAGGCGLADYEKRMDAQRGRLLVIDEENRYLGEMLKLPPADQDKTWIIRLKRTSSYEGRRS
jgi:hypothetical protein